MSKRSGANGGRRKPRHLALALIAAFVLAAAALITPNTIAASAGTAHKPVHRAAVTPNVILASDTTTGIACNSSTDCWVVGFNANSGSNLAYHWAGSDWTSVPVPTGGGDQNQLRGLSCVSTNFCVAVGYIDDGAHEQLLKWNGTAWSQMTRPNNSSGRRLWGVYCTSSSDCMATGDTVTGSTLAEHFNGTAWSIVATITPNGVDDAILRSVVCTSSSNCWAVGSAQLTGGGGVQALIERYDGVAWSSAAVGTSSTQAELNGVICLSPSDCRAVGYDHANALIDQWDGSSWTTSTQIPPEGQPQANIQSIFCNASNDCWRVGIYGHVSLGLGAAMAQHWNGTDWTTVSTATPDPADDFVSITCVATDNCWATGNATSSDGSQTSLVEHDALVAPALRPLSRRSANPLVAGPAFSVGDASVVLGASGTRYLAFTITTDQKWPSATSVQYTLVDGTATSSPTFQFVPTPDHRRTSPCNGGNYRNLGTPVTVSFPMNATEKVVKVTACNTSVPITNGTFTLTIGNPSAGTIGRAVGTGTINPT